MPAHATDGGAGAVRLVTQFVVISVAAGVLLAGMVLPLAGTAGYVARSSTEHFERLPSELATPPLPERSTVLAADGTKLATFYSENRIVVPIDRMAQTLRMAVIAIEDSRFYRHHGLDVKGTTRALLRNTAAGGVQQGGSTLTQQYVKNVLLENATNKKEQQEALEQSISRKLQELRYAVALEKKLTKNEILERYLNIAYFGSGAYGAEAASLRYFSKPAADLELHEGALLAGIIRAPGSYDPTDYPDEAEDRRNVVLDRMAALGMISSATAEKAKAQPLGLDVSPLRNGCTASAAPFFCDYVRSVIAEEPAFGKTRDDREELLDRGGLTIHTTLQPSVHTAARRSLIEWTNSDDKVGASVVMVEPGTGRIRAMAQNHPYSAGTYINYAVNKKYGGSSGFQGGSTFKPFVLAAALDQGLPLSLRLTANDDMTVDGFKDCKTGAPRPWTDPITNYSDSSYGSIDMRTATWRSVNTYYAQLEERTGICEPVNLARRMGLERANGDRVAYNPSFVLGTDEVSPLGMAEAYATFAARGKHCDAVAITKVTDRDGKRLDVPRPQCRQVLDQDVADAVNYVLEDVISGPDPQRTGAAMDIGRPAAGKTGTTSGTYAVWFAGYTPQLATAVWVGHPKGSISLENVTIGGRYYGSLCGGCLPGPIWRDAMLGALEGRPALSFVEPPVEFRFGETVTVPDVSGLSYAQARAVLVDAGLSYELSSDRVSSSVPAGLVATTDPGEGSTVDVGTTVTIFLSSGRSSPPERGGGRGGAPDPAPPPGDGGGNGGPGGGKPGRDKPGKPGKPGPG